MPRPINAEPLEPFLLCDLADMPETFLLCSSQAEELGLAADEAVLPFLAEAMLDRLCRS